MIAAIAGIAGSALSASRLMSKGTCEADSATWSNWNIVYNNTATSCTASATWSEWNIDYSTCSNYVTSCTASVTQDVTWAYWVSESDGYVLYNGSGVAYRPAAIVETPEEKAAREQREREALEAQLAETAERARLLFAADERARKLLLENLTAAQQEELHKDRAFTVYSKDGMRKYKIREGRAQNIDVYDATGKRTHILCAHPADNVPNPDSMLAQKLMLEHAEDEFLAVANRTAVRA